jgi:hypothetical protein
MDNLTNVFGGVPKSQLGQNSMQTESAVQSLEKQLYNLHNYRNTVVMEMEKVSRMPNSAQKKKRMSELNLKYQRVNQDIAKTKIQLEQYKNQLANKKFLNYDQTDYDKNFMSYSKTATGNKGCTCGNSGQCLTCSQKQLESEVFNFASDCGCGGHSNYAGDGDCGCGGHSNYANFSISDIRDVASLTVAEQEALKAQAVIQSEKEAKDALIITEKLKTVNKTMVIVGVGLLLFAGYKLYKSKK